MFFWIKKIAREGFDPSTFGLWAQRAASAPSCYVVFWHCGHVVSPLSSLDYCEIPYSPSRIWFILVKRLWMMTSPFPLKVYNAPPRIILWYPELLLPYPSKYIVAVVFTTYGPWYLHFLETSGSRPRDCLFPPPDVGLEPTTTSLKGWRSTDWANRV